MAGRIRASDIDEVKSRTNIADVIGEHVALKSAGVGSLKGLCPFHDERSPSFHVKSTSGFYHCFGCGESGDVYSFMQKMDHVTFTEAVERLAERLGFQLTYEEGGSSKPGESGNRARLLAANAAAAEFFVAQLATPGAAEGRKFLGERGFDKAAAEQFGIGFAPKSWSELRDHLKSKGYTDEEMLAAGLLSQGDKGPYDRFRGRLVWPIRDVTGQTIGFGARKLFDDDKGPKYLNTPETPVYHKAQVLYGLDLAKRDIGKTRRVVVVEGYTDVMAAHLSGVTTAVATCGTAFGVDHIKLIRRVMGDDSGLGEVIFAFDPDAAGQKAALRAFGEQARFTAQTFVAVAPEGLDPCDLRLNRGEQAVRDLVDAKVPMFEFVIRTLLKNYNLDTVEGRIAALREAAPIIADIRDGALKPGYTRELARLTGVDIAEAQQAVSRASSAARNAARNASAVPGQSGFQPEGEPYPSDDEFAPVAPVTFADLGRDPSVRLERDALMAILQHPEMISDAQLDDACASQLSQPVLDQIRAAIGANRMTRTEPTWLQTVMADANGEVSNLITQLAIAPLPELDPKRIELYVRGIVSSLVERDLIRQKNDLVSRLQRVGSADPTQSRVIQEELLALENKRRNVRGY
jgi:DNA primase